jgi:YVTN family beta-propeller protein
LNQTIGSGLLCRNQDVLMLRFFLKTLGLFLITSLGTPAVPAAEMVPSFVNFESAPVHPIAVSPNGETLAVCNTPDGRIELFDVATGIPVSTGNIPVGLDPVSVRFRGDNELWVVNFISSSVNVVDLSRRRVTAVLRTLAGPADLVFAGAPEYAFVSCARSNAVMVFDAETHDWVTNIPIDGERPKALAVTPDGSTVYVAIFESGNASTILGANLVIDESTPMENVVDDPNGPYSGVNPPPNSGNGFSPALNPNLPASPRESHIVKKDSAGRWTDDNNADWTEFVSGTNAARSRRVVGWDMPDRDVAVIDTSTFSVSYIHGLMNICMDLAVNPASGKLAVIGTDALNERRFEPNLQSIFVRVDLALIDPVAGTKVITDLNPHLDYVARRIPQTERDKSIGDPRAIAWTSDGTRCYVAGMGSRNVVMLDENGSRLAAPPIEVQEGPSGLALDEVNHRLYVLNRFSASVSVIDTDSSSVITHVPFFDPTPEFIKAGRTLLYDTRRNSGLGQVSCASCHVDGRFDRLAWNLGDPGSEMITNQFGVFHPMKGPKVTQTLQALNPVGALHWRADRDGIGEFKQTFVKLLGKEVEPNDAEMESFGKLLQSIFFPPNPLRNFDNTLSTNVPLPGQFSYYSLMNPAAREALPNGNALRGANVFRSNCSVCHNPGSGLGDPSANSVLGLLTRNSGQPFKVAQLRSLADKTGFDMAASESRAGFGFSHDGRADTLSRFLGDGFGIRNTEASADLIAFLLSFSGSDIEMASFEGFESIESNLDAPAALGYQILVATPESNSVLTAMMALADSPSATSPYNTPSLEHRVDLIVRGHDETGMRGWYYIDGFFQSDRDDELISASDLLTLASPTNELLWMLVPRGCGRRIATDRDDDFTLDGTERQFGLDPANSLSHSTNNPLYLDFGFYRWLLSPRLDAGFPYQQEFTVLGVDPHGDDWLLLSGPVEFSLEGNPPDGATIDPVTGRFSWVPRPEHAGQTYRVPIRAGYVEGPPMSATVVLRLTVNAPISMQAPRLDPVMQRVMLKLQARDNRTVRVEYTDDITATVPTWSNLGFIYEELTDPTWPLPARRFYRAVVVP